MTARRKSKEHSEKNPLIVIDDIEQGEIELRKFRKEMSEFKGT